MNWFDWIRLALIIPTSLAVIGLIAVLIADINKNK